MLNKRFERIILPWFSFLFIFTSAFSQGLEQKLLLVCGDSKVFLVDYEKSIDSIPEVVWMWDAHLAGDLPEEFRTKKFNSIDDCKSIDGGEKIMISSSSGAVAILERKTDKVLFYANVPNAHSIELLPNNRLVAAASTENGGNKIMLFDINRMDRVLYSESLYSAHGVVWDDGSNRLYALGYDVLCEYSLVSQDSLSLISKWDIPGVGGHDLYLSPGGNGLFMTEHTGSWFFDFENKSFNKIEGFPDAENIKSIGQNKSGQFIFTVPEESWWTNSVSFFNPTRRLVFPETKVYKARWYNQE